MSNVNSAAPMPWSTAPAQAAPVDPSQLSDERPSSHDPFAERTSIFGRPVSLGNVAKEGLFLAAVGAGVGFLGRSHGSKAWLGPAIGAAIGAGIGATLELINVRGPQVGTGSGKYESGGYRGGSHIVSGSATMRLGDSTAGSADTLSAALGSDPATIGGNVAFVVRDGGIERRAITTDGSWNELDDWHPSDTSIVAYTNPDGSLHAGPGASARDRYEIQQAYGVDAGPVQPRQIDWDGWLKSL